MQAMSDKKSAVRSNAIEKLGSWFADEDFTEIYKKTITTDSSYMVIGSALKALTEKKRIRRFGGCRKFRVAK
jgi:hypothetical protein